MTRVGRTPIRRGTTTKQRAAARAGINLKGLGITVRTEQRYNSAVAQVLPVLETVSSLEELDVACEEWIETQWVRGTPLGTIGDALCALHYYWPQVKGHLRGSWKLYKNWRRIELPQRAPPLPLPVVRAMVGYLLDRSEPHMAFLTALGYHAYLRTGEILRLRVKDVLLTPTKGVISLEPSKSGLRFNSREAVAIYDKGLHSLWELCHLPRPMAPEDLVWPRSPQAFRSLFYNALSALKADGEKFQPYSLRRGGATYDYMTQGTMEAIILRGRWRSLAVARLYLEDGLAHHSQVRLSKEAWKLINNYSRGLPSALLP